MNSQKKIVSIVLGIIFSFAMSVVCLAQPATTDTPDDQKVFVTFVYGGSSSGEWVVKGTSVTPPEVPVIAGATFCGWSAPLTNIQTNQQINAVYKSNTEGEAVIEAAKRALPAPAISATRVADPNAAPVVALPASTPVTTAVPASVAPVAVATGNATASSTATAATAADQAKQQQLLALILAQQQAQQKAAANTAAVPNASSGASNGVIVPTHSETGDNLVWVPVNGGKKYHKNASCSDMINPMQVTIETAQNNGYTACKICYK